MVTLAFMIQIISSVLFPAQTLMSAEGGLIVPLDAHFLQVIHYYQEDKHYASFL